MTLFNLVLLVIIALLLVLSLHAYSQYLITKQLLQRTVARSLRALRARGVHKKKAVDLVCPELRDSILK